MRAVRSGEKGGDGMRRDVCGMSGLNVLQREECGAGSGFGTAILRVCMDRDDMGMAPCGN